MDTNTLTNSMRDLIENLMFANPDDCSDEFQLTLNKLIEKAHQISSSITLRRVKQHEKQRRSATSPDDIRCLAPEIPIVNLDSDSDEVTVPFDGDSSSSANDRLGAVTKKHNKINFDLNLELKKISKKRCMVKLRRIDTITGSSSPIQGSTDNGRMHATPVIHEKEAVTSSGHQVR